VSRTLYQYVSLLIHICGVLIKLRKGRKGKNKQCCFLKTHTQQQQQRHSAFRFAPQLTCAQIFEGFAIPHAVMRTNVAGRDVTEYLQTLLRRAGYDFHTSAGVILSS
jgi:hypothetical protein